MVLPVGETIVSSTGNDWRISSTFAGMLVGALNSDDGVQAHMKMKAKTNAKEPVLCFTAAKLHNFEELKESKELKRVKRQ